jgi:hypothetical protein
MTPQTPLEIPKMFADNFARAYGAFVKAVHQAVEETIPNPALASTPEFLSWQTDALPLLEAQNAAVQEAYARFLIGETRTIVAVAAERRHLGKELDGLPLTFAGPDRAGPLASLKTSAVVTASRLCQAAGVP